MCSELDCARAFARRHFAALMVKLCSSTLCAYLDSWVPSGVDDVPPVHPSDSGHVAGQYRPSCTRRSARHSGEHFSISLLDKNSCVKCCRCAPVASSLWGSADRGEPGVRELFCETVCIFVFAPDDERSEHDVQNIVALCWTLGSLASPSEGVALSRKSDPQG